MLLGDSSRLEYFGDKTSVTEKEFNRFDTMLKPGDYKMAVQVAYLKTEDNMQLCMYSSFSEVVEFLLASESAVTTHATQPTGFSMAQNYPNPFNPTTGITYAIPVSNHVSIDVFNMTGQKVKTLVDQYMTAGTYRIEWDGTDDAGRSMTSGTYFYKMSSSHFNSVKKMLLVK
jgi:hypothetical protein